MRIIKNIREQHEYVKMNKKLACRQYFPFIFLGIVRKRTEISYRQAVRQQKKN